MKDYELIAEILEMNVIDNKWYNSSEFKKYAEDRNIKKLKTVCGDCVERLEIWGNSEIEILIKHDMFTNEFKIL